MTEKYKRIEQRMIRDVRNPPKNSLLIIYSGKKGWSIVPYGKVRAIRVLPTKEEAISYAKNFLEEGEISIHNTDGTVNSSIRIG